ncbi:MAG: prepilin-type N-terminal cleavage/methylation domain-containing protein [Puniceicoccales bacterium]|jgi:prepilin-type N-terminal cleavage/methylation domain-containing protein|nr:prepilin-type N-terminal cleavage/methylation domain-containing protein [Puniceicoccales bacterium]
MKTSYRISRTRGFTLVEILAVIAILGILMALVASQAPVAFRKVNQMRAKSQLRDIVATAKGYGKPITATKAGGKTVGDYASVLAEAGLKKGSTWYLSGDLVEANGNIPESVLENGTNKIKEVKPAGWAVVFNARKRGVEGTADHPYPLAWTRGLQVGGSWNENSGPWGKEGGHVGYGDGAVEWYTSLDGDDEKGVLFKYGNSKDERTKSYQEAIQGTVTSSSGENPEAIEDQASAN